MRLMAAVPAGSSSLGAAAGSPADATLRGRGPVLEAKELTRSFGHVQALRGASLRVDRGEVVGLVGDNGAGKSTLIKALAGALTPDSGSILVDGQPTRLLRPADARRLGIETVYQDLALAADLDATANLFLGRELRRPGLGGRIGLLDDPEMQRRAPELLAGLGVQLSSFKIPVAALSGGQRQIIAVARALLWATRLVLMDEPTAALGVRQTEHVAQLTRAASQRGIAVVLVSHNLPELLQLVDRVEVLRLGRVVASMSASEATTSRLVAAMTGLDPESEQSRWRQPRP
jgi:simple sugar transport system ATP-binding protein